ncbi:DUF2332 domain-containing protein [Nitratireductor pacificus]|uniref:DUF2332 domain-containing protein n=1 Tax=Nitratireductor pacificus pht-3B TaxID=391937 RepID=K2MN49_9HYPH|nr:DUF2332 family protein [Nitratireductor pacificus]EKF18667.1 hypothetical protein NA2_12244 [Nitratireductor pacificus pht-3B]
MDRNDIAGHFEKQAQACDRMGSPFTARLCRLLPDLLEADTQTGRRVLEWPGDPRGDALALRLCGGLHGLVLSGHDTVLAAAYPPNAVSETALRQAVANAIAGHDDRLCTNLDSAPQTNEIGRSAMLLPGFLAIARETGLPLDLHEIGSSAGLNLLFDRFHYRYGDAAWGEGSASVQLAPEVRGGAPVLEGALHVAGRRGSDIAPIDVSLPDERLRLTSYVWADQTARLERLAAAIGLAAHEPYQLEREDAAIFVERALAGRRSDAVFVLFHSIMWQYLPVPTRQRIAAALAVAGAAGGAPIAWLRMEPGSANEPYALVQLTLWPEGTTRDLARCDFHGRWIEWLADL